MNIREVELYDANSQSRMKWFFDGSVYEAETDLRKFVKKMGITHWFGSISAMQGKLKVMPL